MTWMLTGGAGYIGAHVTRALLESGRPVVVLDDLSTGLARKVPDGVPLEQVDVRDRAAVADVLRRHEVTGVVHLAAKKAVGESVERPHFYYRQNVEGAMALTEAMAEVGVRRLVYSSSASVYGPTDAPLITEDSATLPISPYGQTKLIGEWIGADLAVAEGFSVVALRYFNVAGAGGDDLGDTGAFNLIPLVLRAHTSGAATARSSAPTTRPRTAPASATTSTSPTWPPVTWPQRSAPRPASPASRRTTSGAASGRRSAR